MRALSILLVFLLIVLITACAPVTARPDIDPALAEKEAEIQKKMAIEARINDFQRLSDVSSPILVNGAALCGDEVTYFIGMDTNSIDAIPDDWKKAYTDVLGLEERVKITYVIKGSPAQKAGLKKGDVLLMMNGNKIEPGKDSYKKFFKSMNEQLASGRTMVFWIEREGGPRMIQVTPQKRCDYPVVMTDDMVVNAYADGDSVIITKGMMGFAEDDKELALIIGHELGHNIMGHIEKKTGNRIMGAILDGLIAGVTGVRTNAFTNAVGNVYSQDYEQEADYVGMYFMERGGYDCSQAAMFWRRMGANFPYAIGHATTHPTSASRYVFLEECALEIKNKKEKGIQLLPDMEADEIVMKQ